MVITASLVIDLTRLKDMAAPQGNPGFQSDLGHHMTDQICQKQPRNDAMDLTFLLNFIYFLLLIFCSAWTCPAV